MTYVTELSLTERLEQEHAVVGLYDSQPESAKDIRALSTTLNIDYSRCYYILRKNKRLPPSDPATGSRSVPLSELNALLGQHIQSYRYTQNTLGGFEEVSATETAEALGMSLKKYRRIEKGTSELSLKDLDLIAKFYGAKLSDMFKAIEKFRKEAQ